MRFRRGYSFGTLALLLSGIAAADCPQILSNNEFTSGTLSPWVIETPYSSVTVDYTISADSYHALNLVVDAFDSDPWPSDAALSQSIALVAGQQYRLTFWARGEAWDGGNVPVTVKVGQAIEPYAPYGLEEDIQLSYNAGSGANYTYTFTANTTDPQAGLVFMFGLVDADITFDSIFLEQISSPSCPSGTGGSAGSGGAAGSSSVATGGTSSGGTGTGGTSGITGAVVLANQVGYVRQAEKVATVKHAATSALDWQLLDVSSNILTSGVTRAMALDPISGDYVHLADFSSYTTAGAALRLRVGDATSQVFRIGGDSFGALRRDALRFYYYQRASSAVSQPYAEGSEWVRDAGHPDTSVPCRSGSGCSYSLNVSRGWYDAGDYGKYVVNGGISAWTLMHLYERAQHLGTSASALADGSLNIPESANGVSDLLDEVRWEMEFLLGMQVPAGQTLAGMAHHKVHGTTWPAIPIAPVNDATGRVLSAPSTAATLNLAATAAQCARIFSPLDGTFATRCRTAAETAYSAAEANPSIYAVSTPAGGGDDDGGGAYDDADVTDEFYWAAAELYATTGNAKYLNALLASPHHLQIPSTGAPLNWSSTATAGALTLATVPSSLAANVLSDVRHAVVNAADAYQAIAATAYGTAIQSYFWGSNSDVLNAGIVLALAYDLTGSAAYRAAALGALDYVLGRNPLGKSYVTGYGTAPFVNAHHRFFAHAFNSSWPTPPPGIVAGGPNQNLDGLTTPGSLMGCVGPKCWTDNAAAYGLTEITINWNAPLAWMAAWASEQEVNPKTTFPGLGIPNTGTGGSNAGGASGGPGQGGYSTKGAGGIPTTGTSTSGGAALGGAAMGGAATGAIGGNATIAQAGSPINQVQGGSPATSGTSNAMPNGGSPIGGNAATIGGMVGGNGTLIASIAGGSAIDTPNPGSAGSANALPIGGSNATAVAGSRAGLSVAGNGAVSTGASQDPECNCRTPGSKGANRSWLAMITLALLWRRKRRQDAV